MGAAAETEMVGLAQLTRRSKRSSVGKISALKLCLIWSENVVSLAEKTKLALLSTCCCVLFQRLRADSKSQHEALTMEVNAHARGKKKNLVMYRHSS